MFSETAELYDLIYSEWKDYAAESRDVAEIIERWRPGARTVLDIGCGTGRHARLLHDAHGLEVDGLDLNPEFVRIARDRCPTGRFVEGNMTGFDMGRTYDVVLSLFSAIGYVRTFDRLVDTAACIAAHLESDGVCVVEPWFEPDAFEDGHVHMATVDRSDVKIARVNHAVVRDGVSILDFHYVVADAGGVRHAREVHELGLFTTQQMREAFERGGLEVIDYDPVGPIGRGLYVVGKSGR